MVSRNRGVFSPCTCLEFPYRDYHYLVLDSLNPVQPPDATHNIQYWYENTIGSGKWYNIGEDHEVVIHVFNLQCNGFHRAIIKAFYNNSHHFSIYLTDIRQRPRRNAPYIHGTPLLDFPDNSQLIPGGFELDILTLFFLYSFIHSFLSACSKQSQSNRSTCLSVKYLATLIL